MLVYPASLRDLTDCGWRGPPRTVPQQMARSNDCYLTGYLKDNQESSNVCMDFGDLWGLSYDNKTFIDEKKVCGLGTQVCVPRACTIDVVVFTITPTPTHSCFRHRTVARKLSTYLRTPREAVNKRATTLITETSKAHSTPIPPVPMAARVASVCRSACLDGALTEPTGSLLATSARRYPLSHLPTIHTNINTNGPPSLSVQRMWSSRAEPHSGSRGRTASSDGTP